MDIDPNTIDPALSGGAAGPSRTTTTNPPIINGSEEGGEEDDDDPIVATYNILLKPSLPAHRKIVILEHPNKSDGKKPARAPLEIRMKPGTGMFEIDYPMDYNSFYDRNKGLAWGTHLNKSTEAKKGGSHGLAGGFGVGAPPPRARGAKKDGDEFEFGMDWAEALRKDYVLRTQTLGGQAPNATEESKYMVGVFSGENLHLTPASSLVHLRPQLHHIDATSEQEKLSSARATAAAGGGAQPGKEGPARAIHMTIKSAGADGEEIVQETMADRLRKVQIESWSKMRYVHDEASDSWAMSEDALYLQPKGGDESSGDAAAIAAGKEPEVAPGQKELVDRLAKLQTVWDEEHMLEKTSGVEKEKIEIEIDESEVPKPVSPVRGRGKGKAAADGAEKKKPGRPKGSTTAAKKATIVKSKASSTTTSKAGPPKAMEID